MHKLGNIRKSKPIFNWLPVSNINRILVIYNRGKKSYYALCLIYRHETPSLPSARLILVMMLKSDLAKSITLMGDVYCQNEDSAFYWTMVCLIFSISYEHGKSCSKCCNYFSLIVEKTLFYLSLRILNSVCDIKLEICWWLYISLADWIYLINKKVVFG